MLYPQNNAHRQFVDLSGVWSFAFDERTDGRENGFEDGRPLAVPASWNDQFADGRDDLGPGWYQVRFDLPWGFWGKRVQLRFGSVNYLADVWLNGTFLGRHEGGHLPFVFEANDALEQGDNLLVVRVDGQLAFDRVPPGNVTGEDQHFFAGHAGNFPQAQFDFFPFCGIHRPVYLVALPPGGIDDITVTTGIEGEDGLVDLVVQHGADRTTAILSGFGQTVQAENGHFIVPGAKLWSTESPNLYQLTVILWDGEQEIDRYTLRTGIREIKIDGNQLLLNGEAVYLKGFGRHEDFPISGRGLNLPVVVKDFALLQWIGANSFRTTHYPYSEEMMQLADELGFLIIDETPAVGLYFRPDGLQRRNELCRQQIREMIARDKNHPSVIMWSIANEPHSAPAEAVESFQEMSDLVRDLDPTRPVTLVSFRGVGEESFAFLDVVCLNRYRGWYSQPGQIAEGCKLLSEELDALYERYQKPIILSEFGTDTIPGWHAQPPEMFSEEYQVAFITQTIDVLRSKPYVIGEHVWNMCDFKTSQGITRVGGLNHKGVFTRDRRPKMAAHALKDLWK